MLWEPKRKSTLKWEKKYSLFRRFVYFSNESNHWFVNVWKINPEAHSAESNLKREERQKFNGSMEYSIFQVWIISKGTNEDFSFFWAQVFLSFFSFSLSDFSQTQR